MPGRLDARLRRLKRLKKHDEPCPECGSGEAPTNARIVVEWEDVDGEECDPYTGPEFCPECGAQLVYEVTWKDLEAQDGNR